MSETAVSKKTSETPMHRSSSDIFQPTFPLTRLARMNPFALSPFTMMREFANEMDRVFRDPGVGTELQAWAPPVDVQQCDGTLVISAELPGMKREDVKVGVNDDTLTIQASGNRSTRKTTKAIIGGSAIMAASSAPFRCPTVRRPTR